MSFFCSRCQEGVQPEPPCDRCKKDLTTPTRFHVGDLVIDPVYPQPTKVAAVEVRRGQEWVAVARYPGTWWAADRCRFVEPVKVPYASFLDVDPLDTACGGI
jgi:hypothetical protein